MALIIYQNGIKLRKTREDELEFVLKNENDDENRKYIKQWALEQHRQALSDDDILHMIIIDALCLAV